MSKFKTHTAFLTFLTHSALHVNDSKYLTCATSVIQHKIFPPIKNLDLSILALFLVCFVFFIQFSNKVDSITKLNKKVPDVRTCLLYTSRCV